MKSRKSGATTHWAFRLAGLACLLALAPRAWAHDFWIEPPRSRIEPGELLLVELRVGDHGRGEPVPRNESRIARFEASGPDGTLPLVGRDGDQPAGLLRPDGAGTWILSYRSKPAVAELEPALFEHYLEEEGLDRALARWRELEREPGGEDRSTRELYSRCAKALVRVGPGPLGDRALGLPLELVAEGDPSAGAAGAKAEPLAFRLLLAGEPLAGAQVEAIRLDGEAGAATEPLRARTDAEGRAAFPPLSEGRWLVAAVHMNEVSGAGGSAGHEGEEPRARWESLWASLTFQRESSAP